MVEFDDEWWERFDRIPIRDLFSPAELAELLGLETNPLQSPTVSATVGGMEMNDTSNDQSHSCRGCGENVYCGTPSDECDDHPGDCADCAATEKRLAQCRTRGEANAARMIADYGTDVARQVVDTMDERAEAARAYRDAYRARVELAEAARAVGGPVGPLPARALLDQTMLRLETAEGDDLGWLDTGSFGRWELGDRIVIKRSTDGWAIVGLADDLPQGVINAALEQLDGRIITVEAAQADACGKPDAGFPCDLRAGHDVDGVDLEE